MEKPDHKPDDLQETKPTVLADLEAPNAEEINGGATKNGNVYTITFGGSVATEGTQPK